MKTRRRRAVVGAIGATTLLLAATACSSGSDDSGAQPVPEAAVESTVGITEAPDEAPAATTEAPATSTSEPDAGDADPAPTDPPAVVVPEALQFTAPLVGGGTFDGAATAGKPTVFWFWAPT